ncbi:MAG: HAMP domain-containing histidine kinase [Bacteroidetes bacterium]|nr:HAMP domain-containing histidine kinase [Bacteroidota bacterium]MBU1680295.1 HAMP domain-containing histidine kinase [Bacteroidota bacterium]MBU2505758.1 HAMP domain-containing histidine kinase [Bacteroidota bacterium]
MKMSGGPASLHIKLFLLSIGLFIAVGTLIYTQSLVNRLQKREKQTVELFASSLEYVANPKLTDIDFTFHLDVIKKIDFPLILTDANDVFTLSNLGGGIRNLEIDSTLSESEKIEFIKGKIEELRALHPPIPVMYDDAILLNKIYYGDSELVSNLRYYPYLQIIFALIFILISYISFSYLKKNEQSNIWVGMSKETAHQLGTPISSLMGWNEILKLNHTNADKVIDISGEIDDDLIRLNKIANRFSKIGSKPELKEQNVYDVISKVIEYFQRRIPNFSNKVNLTLEGNTSSHAKLNIDLFEWVIENLIKNALDAIEKKDGFIKVVIHDSSKSIYIEVIDNGKGIEAKRRKDVFRPGYSTKRRGWGLGLSLSRRIIADYHKGRIFVRHSSLEEGTTFQITLRKEK